MRGRENISVTAMSCTRHRAAPPARSGPPAGGAPPDRPSGLRSVFSSHLSSSLQTGLGPRGSPGCAAPAARRVPVAVRRPDEAGIVEPAPAADHPARPVRDHAGRPHGESSFLHVIIGIIPVPAPLPDVPMHVIQAKYIERFWPTSWVLATRVASEPGELTQARFVIAKAETRRSSPRNRRIPTPLPSASDTPYRSSPELCTVSPEIS